MKPDALRGTFARLWEGLFLSVADNISVFSISDARFPPYFFRLMLVAAVPIFFLAGYRPTNPILQLLALVSILGVVISIPIATYLSLKKKEYTLQGSEVREVETFLGRNESSVNLSEVGDAYISEGVIGRILGVGKVCLTTDEGIFQIDYVKDPEQVKADIKRAL
ncbi:PH domain-containing protein [Candidatus Nanohaloarchaea archaeon]|nr:PH domain-containing protein [Candidatus Nanohaloarchaea archaeon]